jgi:hypothetical protein
MSTGVQGNQGLQGPTGAGYTGNTGIQGPQGFQGPPFGPTGIPGVTGPTGAAPTSYIVPFATYTNTLITNTVAASNANPTIVSSIPIPVAAQGLSGIVSVYFDMTSQSSNALTSNQGFDYGLYIDGSNIGMGGNKTTRYIQTDSSVPNMLSSNGRSVGTNSINPMSPLSIPVSIPPAANSLQIGILNSSAILGRVASVQSSMITPTSVTQTSVLYTVPTLANGANVVGIYMYAWGAGGQAYPYQNNASYYGQPFAGAGGYASGFFPCSPGTQLTIIGGGYSGTGAIGLGGSGYSRDNGGQGGAYSGGFSGVFLGTTTTQATALLIAGGGGAAQGMSTNGVYFGNGGGGGFPNGSPPYQTSLSNDVVGFSTMVTGGTQTSGGVTFGGLPGQPLACSPTNLNGNGASIGGGGFFGGGSGGQGTGGFGGGGGSSYASGLVSGVVFSNGTTVTSNVPLQFSNNLSIAPPGGVAVLSNFGFSGFGNPGASRSGFGGLVLMIPAIASPGPVNIGVDAEFLVV